MSRRSWKSSHAKKSETGGKHFSISKTFEATWFVSSSQTWSKFENVSNTWPVQVEQGFKWSTCTATLMDVHASDQIGNGRYKQNSNLFMPWRPVATIQVGCHGSFPIPLLTPHLLYFLCGGCGFKSWDTQKRNFTSKLFQENYSKQVIFLQVDQLISIQSHA